MVVAVAEVCMVYSHDVVVIPQDGVGVEVCRWIKPEVHPLLSVSLPVRVHVGLNRVWLPRPVPQELKI